MPSCCWTSSTGEGKHLHCSNCPNSWLHQNTTWYSNQVGGQPERWMDQRPAATPPPFPNTTAKTFKGKCALSLSSSVALDLCIVHALLMESMPWTTPLLFRAHMAQAMQSSLVIPGASAGCLRHWACLSLLSDWRSAQEVDAAKSLV